MAVKGSPSVTVKDYGSDFKRFLTMLRHQNTLSITKAEYLQQIKRKLRNEQF